MATRHYKFWMVKFLKKEFVVFEFEVINDDTIRYFIALKKFCDKVKI